MGFFAPFARNGLTAQHDNFSGSRKALPAAWYSYILTLVVFAFEAIGCNFVATRYFYIAEYQHIRFAFFGMCSMQGDVKCTVSLLRQSYEVSSAIGAPEAYVQDALRLQNDTSFASTALALFSAFIGICWFTVFDGDSGYQMYYVYWLAMTWWTSVAFAFNAAWTGTFSVSALQHAQGLANKEIKRGIAYTVFHWIIFLGLTIAALAVIQWTADYSQAMSLFFRNKWKMPYLDLIKPKDGIVMKIVNTGDDGKGPK